MNAESIRHLNKILEIYEKSEPIYLAELKGILVKHYGIEISISELESILFNLGFKRIQLKQPKKRDKNFETNSPFNQVTTSFEEQEPIKKDNFDEEEDFDPNLLIEKNLNTIKKATEQISDFHDNAWMIEKYQKNKDVELLNEIVKNNLGLIKKFVDQLRKIAPHKLDEDDLIAAGAIGLLKAIERYDPKRGNQFSTYAAWWIKQAIQREIFDNGFTISVPVHIFEKLFKIKRYERESLLRFNRIDVQWVIEHAEISEYTYKELQKIDYCFLHLATLDSPVSEDDDDSFLLDFINSESSTITQISELLQDPEVLVEKKHTKIVLESYLDTLKEREREVLKYRFGWDDGKERTLEEIGRIFHVTRERIRQIEEKALNRLRRIVTSELTDV
jgi:RNA polymerase primary sigma factor